MCALTPKPWSEEHWHTLVERAPEAIGVTVEGHLVFANAAMAQLLGAGTPEELLGENMLQWVHPDELPKIVERMRRLERGEEVPRNVVRLVRRDGRTITAESTVVHGTYEGRPAIRLMVRDVTERQKTQQELQFQAKLLDAIGQSVIVTDTEGTITYWNRAAEEIFGWHAADVMGRNIVEVTPAEGMNEHAAEIMNRLQQGHYWQDEFMLRRKDGSTFPGIVSNRPLFDDDGHLTGMIGVTTDITRLKKAEETLRKSEARHRALLAGIPDLILRVSHDGTYLDVHAPSPEDLVLPPGDLIGKNMRELEQSSLAKMWLAAIQKAVASGKTEYVEYAFVPPARDDVQHFEARFTPSDNEVLIVVRNVTERAQAVREIQQRNRELEALLFVSRQISEQLDLDVTFHRIVESVVAILPGADGAALCFHDGQHSPSLVTASRTGYAADMRALLPSEVCTALAGRIAQKQSPTILDATAESLPGEVQRMLGIPLFVAGTSVGALIAVCLSSRDAFTERHGRLLQSVASQASVAIHNARLFRERRRIAIQLAQTQEAERRRVAQELHDEVGALLTSLQLSLKLAHRQATAEPARQEIETARHEINELADMVRRISLDLRPTLLDEFGLVATLHDYLKRYKQQAGIEVHFRHELPEHVHLPPLVATAAYRIVQEALTNVARYAGVPTAQVTLLQEPQVLRVHVIDEGRGFDVQAAWHHKHTLGLTGMRERAALLGGSLDVHSAPGAGTRISASLPLEPHMP